MQNIEIKAMNRNDLFGELEIKKNANIIKRTFKERKGDGCEPIISITLSVDLWTMSVTFGTDE